MGLLGSFVRIDAKPLRELCCAAILVSFILALLCFIHAINFFVQLLASI